MPCEYPEHHHHHGGSGGPPIGLILAVIFGIAVIGPVVTAAAHALTVLIEVGAIVLVVALAAVVAGVMIYRRRHVPAPPTVVYLPETDRMAAPARRRVVAWQAQDALSIGGADLPTLAELQAAELHAAERRAVAAESALRAILAAQDPGRAVLPAADPSPASRYMLPEPEHRDGPQ